ncbi:hypothetical protein OHA98_03675 [Streptomyces sp. NBC_00654]|uniref:hypothetical protein n=1 Tax=Streptomyces sp. NBC_00654 TaxID=2975799 RepID=UPI00225C1DFC|nr:hypothetical protein [Streptomyces sp. NBC_00654]MCX4963934.1 hypothetical protein [Streptomyces sp. NBC_00654]
MLIVWVVTSGGGKENTGDAKPSGSDPVESITPGPSGSGPAISQQPGGRDESGGDAGSDGSNGDTGAAGSAGSGTGGTTGSDGASSGGAGTGGTAGQQVPADSPLPDCTPDALQLSLRTKVSYGPEDRPKFELIAKNSSATACKADFGPKNAVLTITEAGDDDTRVWSSKDCPATPGRLLLKLPAGATVIHTVAWDRTQSAPRCATPPAAKAGPGTYLLEATAPGEPLQRASFVLAKD